MGLTQYAIVLVNLDPTIGHEIRKTRPCLVLSPDEMNRHLRTVIICPMTSSLKRYPTRVPIRFQEIEGELALDQIRTIDQRRVIRVLGRPEESVILEVKDRIREMLVD